MRKKDSKFSHVFSSQEITNLHKKADTHFRKILLNEKVTDQLIYKKIFIVYLAQVFFLYQTMHEALVTRSNTGDNLAHRFVKMKDDNKDEPIFTSLFRLPQMQEVGNSILMDLKETDSLAQQTALPGTLNFIKILRQCSTTSLIVQCCTNFLGDMNGGSILASGFVKRGIIQARANLYSYRLSASASNIQQRLKKFIDDEFHVEQISAPMSLTFQQILSIANELTDLLANETRLNLVIRSKQPPTTLPLFSTNSQSSIKSRSLILFALLTLLSAVIYSFTENKIMQSFAP